MDVDEPPKRENSRRLSDIYGSQKHEVSSLGLYDICFGWYLCIVVYIHYRQIRLAKLSFDGKPG